MIVGGLIVRALAERVLPHWQLKVPELREQRNDFEGIPVNVFFAFAFPKERLKIFMMRASLILTQ